MKYRKKPIVIEATQWFQNGDHPEVRFYGGSPNVGFATKCKECSQIMSEHGRIATLEGDHIVCPGDWIITGIKGERYPCKPDIFDATYEPVRA